MPAFSDCCYQLACKSCSMAQVHEETRQWLPRVVGWLLLCKCAACLALCKSLWFSKVCLTVATCDDKGTLLVQGERRCPLGTWRFFDYSLLLWNSALLSFHFKNFKNISKKFKFNSICKNLRAKYNNCQHCSWLLPTPGTIKIVLK